MEIKDYLHLYLGCEVQVNGWRYKSKLSEIHIDGVVVRDSFTSKIAWGNFALILRPLSDMTKEEDKYYHSMDWKNYIYSNTLLSAAETLYLLKQGFDLFGLIDAGLAIDKTKIKQ